MNRRQHSLDASAPANGLRGGTIGATGACALLAGAFDYGREHRMTTPFPLRFAAGRMAMARHVNQPSELPAALTSLGLQAPRPVVVLVGGAGGLGPADLDRLRPLFEPGIVPMLTRLGAAAIDGGTWSGVMRLLGESRSSARADFPSSRWLRSAR